LADQLEAKFVESQEPAAASSNFIFDETQLTKGLLDTISDKMPLTVEEVQELLEIIADQMKIWGLLCTEADCKLAVGSLIFKFPLISVYGTVNMVESLENQLLTIYSLIVVPDGWNPKVKFVFNASKLANLTLRALERGIALTSKEVNELIELLFEQMREIAPV